MKLLYFITIPQTIQHLISADMAVVQLFNIWINVMFFTALSCFIIGELTQNYSQVDKIWSIMPIVYSLITLASIPTSPRLLLMTILVALWGMRLSYNFYRKGGYNIIPWKGEEDYRWGKLRENPLLKKRYQILLFNLVFISFYQHILIMLFSTPLLLAAQYTDIELNTTDYIATSFMFIFILIEAISDNQLYKFQLQKKGIIPHDYKFKQSLAKGFMNEGFWKYVRHPNFAAEQATWVSFYFFGVAASGNWINWTLIGPILLIFLFAGSSSFTESISMRKYPDYADYKATIPRFIPFRLKKDK